MNLRYLDLVLEQQLQATNIVSECGVWFLGQHVTLFYNGILVVSPSPLTTGQDNCHVSSMLLQFHANGRREEGGGRWEVLKVHIIMESSRVVK